MYVDSPSVDIACEPTRPWSDMSSYTFSQKLFRPTPPERGSFPLDHEGVPQLPYGPQPDGSRGLVQARLRRRPAQRDIDLDLVVDQLLRRLYCPRRCLPDRVVVGTQAIASRILLLKVELLRSWGYKEVSCIKKLLMCGDEGMGAMAEVDTIVQTTVRMLEPRDSYMYSAS
ncbi:PREDICTED: uncharacterized protein LOC106751925 isoform X3 [Dinoponera quadriceps]|uniref:Uncharacterized protein LOC106751925 isoform X3 n=1 Tax=Dinoponera quadriceps TaxID=609295 RepID=A0A6P3YG16_DINQU|nr:PREDICTED: uncharacterized protein LOC106751925 isoform X3 [Dinoponera quadriceps]